MNVLDLGGAWEPNLACFALVCCILIFFLLLVLSCFVFLLCQFIIRYFSLSCFCPNVCFSSLSIYYPLFFSLLLCPWFFFSFFFINLLPANIYAKERGESNLPLLHFPARFACRLRDWSPMQIWHFLPPTNTPRMPARTQRAVATAFEPHVTS